MAARVACGRVALTAASVTAVSMSKTQRGLHLYGIILLP
jgi:hypothetical protein